jgi:hypothetical protein
LRSNCHCSKYRNLQCLTVSATVTVTVTVTVAVAVTAAITIIAVTFAIGADLKQGSPKKFFR